MMTARYLLQLRPCLLTGLMATLFLPLAFSSALGADRTKPTTPTTLRATSISSTSVSLAWNPSTDNSGSFTYTVRELNSGQTHSVAQAQTIYAWTGLQPSRSYRFVVFARDGSGNQSDNSNTLTVNTPATPPLTVPANVRVASAAYTSLTFTWDPVPGATYYQVMVGATLYSAWGQPGYTVYGLFPGTTLQFSVRAVNTASGPWSTPITGSTLTDSNPPSAPTLAGFATSSGAVHLAWTASSDDAGPVGYNVYVNEQAVPAQSMLVSSSAPLMADVFNLRAATTYQFTVKAYDIGGNLTASQPLQITTPPSTDTTSPAAPGNLRVMPWWGNGISSVGLMWDGSPDNVGTAAYEVYMDGSLANEVLLDVQYQSLDNFVIVHHIPPGTAHTFTVVARDEACNESAASNPVTVTMNPSADVTPPTAPTNLTGDTSPGCGFIDFLFNNSTDDTDSPSQLIYEVYEDGIYRGIWDGTVVFEASFGRHTYYLRALDRAGNRSAPSNTIVLDSGFDC